jgi:hypothetical protein
MPRLRAGANLEKETEVSRISLHPKRENAIPQDCAACGTSATAAVSNDGKALLDGREPKASAPGRRGPQRAGKPASKALKSLPERCEADG